MAMLSFTHPHVGSNLYVTMLGRMTALGTIHVNYMEDDGM